MQETIAIYKPKGPTSHDIIHILRKITGIKKIGHAGTLDPLAKGVLVVGIGREATKKLGDIVNKEKEYLATIKFGENSSTDDLEGKKKRVKVEKKPGNKLIKKIVSTFIGKIYQKPPDFSAVKIKGKSAYKLARQGKKLNIKARKILIKNIKILSYHWPYLKIKVICGPGVYIRSLAHDLGKKLKTGGYLYQLERTRVDDYTKEKAISLQELKKNYAKKKIVQTLCILYNKKQILLGMKKRDFGKGRWNGFGGKIEGDESLEESIKRETKEEISIALKKIKKRGMINFEFDDKTIKVHLFSTNSFEGQPKETEEMKPKWFKLDKIPYDNMWVDDRLWLPLILKGKNIKGKFYFKDENTIIKHDLQVIK